VVKTLNFQIKSSTKSCFKICVTAIFFSSNWANKKYVDNYEKASLLYVDSKTSSCVSTHSIPSFAFSFSSKKHNQEIIKYSRCFSIPRKLQTRINNCIEWINSNKEFCLYSEWNYTNGAISIWNLNVMMMLEWCFGTFFSTYIVFLAICESIKTL
jgi:hypothetical protein